MPWPRLVIILGDNEQIVFVVSTLVLIRGEICLASAVPQGTKGICELMFYLLWQTILATLPFKQISI